MPIQPGARLGPYAIVATVARGGMGEVYEACDTRLDRRVAIKTLRSELLADPQARRRFEREARALSSLSHPNICTVFDVGSHGEVDFIVMEFVDGRPLSALLDEQSLDPQSVVRIAMEVARALADAHDHGVLHRDIKPQNVMITARGDVKVLDFGLAKEIGGLPGEAATTAAASFQGSLAGTAPYMSPEQVRGEPLDARSDVFSLGSLLYELITGRAPFQRRTAAETLAAILGAEPAPLARLASDTSDQLQRIVGKCLEKDRTRRYQTARDVATDLDNLPRDSSRATPSIDSTAGRAGSPDRRLLGSRSARITVAAAALLVALATSAIGFRWTMRPRNAAELRTLAILPLQPLSDSAGENYFGLGIADALITRISGTPSLTVRPTSAVRPYTDGKVDALTAAAALQVDAVLDGAWQRESDRLRVSINLLRVRDGASLWTETVDLPANDVFAVQDKLSQQLAARLQLELDASRAARARKSAGGTHNPQAYDAYLRGSFYLSAREISPQRRQNIDAAIESFERAVALDPKFAEARARLGFAYAYVALAMENNPQLIERAQRETDAAAALNPELGQVFLNRGFILASWYAGWQIVESIRQYRRAEALDPSLSEIELASNYVHLGFYDEWRRTGEQVIARDPANRQARANFVNEHFLLNLPEEGLAAQKRLLNSGPDARYFLLTRRLEEAAPPVERQAAENPQNALYQGRLALLRALQGRPADARAVASRAAAVAVKTRPYHHVTYDLARVHALLGDGDEAARWLRETMDWGFPCYPMFSTDSFLDPVRSAPAVQEVLFDLKVRWEGYRQAAANAAVRRAPGISLVRTQNTRSVRSGRGH